MNISFLFSSSSITSSSLRLNGGPLEAEPDYKKYLSEETAKLQRLYGGGDLSSFPEFTFTGEREIKRKAGFIHNTLTRDGSMCF